MSANGRGDLVCLNLGLSRDPNLLHLGILQHSYFVILTEMERTHLGTVGWRRRNGCHFWLHYFLWSFLLVVSHPFVALPYYKRRYAEMRKSSGVGIESPRFVSQPYYFPAV